MMRTETMLDWLIALAIIGLTCVAICGCAKGNHRVELRTFYPTGDLETEEIIEGDDFATLGSKQDGERKFRYSGQSDGAFDIEAGDVRTQEAGDGAELFRTIVMMGQIFAPMLERPAEAPPAATAETPPAAGNDIESIVRGIVEDIFDNP